MNSELPAPSVRHTLESLQAVEQAPAEPAAHQHTPVIGAISQADVERILLGGVAANELGQ